jgi:hypothetical protein
MSEPRSTSSSPLSPPLPRTLLRVAWMSIALGIVIQILVTIAIRVAPSTWFADLAGKVTWSVLVCTAIAVAVAASKAMPQIAGLVGVLAAPLAINVARTSQKAVGAALAAPVVQAPFTVLPTATEAVIAKAVQYAIFGWFIAKAAKHPSAPTAAGFKRHAAVGLALGLAMVSYVLIRTLTTFGTDTTFANTPALAARLINELVFPVGCATVVWAALAIGSQIKRPSST